MNKQQFLSELEKYLNDLSAEERNDILRDMEEYFREAKSRGRSEEDVLEKLGSPKIFSETIIAEAKVKRIRTASTWPQKISAGFGALLAILLLTPFNLIFVLLPLLLVTLMIIVGWPIVLAIALSLPVVLLVLFFLIFEVGFKLFALLSLLFFAIGWFGMVTAVVVGFFYVTLFYFKGVAKLFQWNIQFIKNRMKGE